MGVLAVYWICTFVKGKWGFIAAEGGSGEERRWLGWTLAASMLALFANPIGWRLLFYPLDLMFHQSTGLGAVEEWLPPDLGTDARWPGGRICGEYSGPLRFAPHGLQLRDLLVVSAAFWLASQHLRMLFVFGIVVSPILCRLLGDELKRDGGGITRSPMPCSC